MKLSEGERIDLIGKRHMALRNPFKEEYHYSNWGMQIYGWWYGKEIGFYWSRVFKKQTLDLKRQLRKKNELISKLMIELAQDEGVMDLPIAYGTKQNTIYDEPAK